MKSHLSVALLVVVTAFATTDALSADEEAILGPRIDLGDLVDLYNGLRQGVTDSLKIAKDLGFMKANVPNDHPLLGKRSVESVPDLEGRGIKIQDILAGIKLGVMEGIKTVKAIREVTDALTGKPKIQFFETNKNGSENYQEGQKAGHHHVVNVSVKELIDETALEQSGEKDKQPKASFLINSYEEIDFSNMGRAGFWDDFYQGFKDGVGLGLEVAQTIGSIAILL